MKLDVYVDVVCPWSYLGKRRLEAALAEYEGRADVQVQWRPLLLETREAAETDAHLTELAGAEGLQLDLAAARQSDTFPAHRLLWWAYQQGGGAAQGGLLERLFAAQLRDGADLGDAAVLAAAAAAAGLTGAAEFLASDDGVEEVKEEIGEARAIGFASTPTFVFEERWAVEGAQPTDVLVELFEQVAGATIGALAGGEGGCCGGGCCG